MIIIETCVIYNIFKLIFNENIDGLKYLQINTNDDSLIFFSIRYNEHILNSYELNKNECKELDDYNPILINSSNIFKIYTICKNFKNDLISFELNFDVISINLINNQNIKFSLNIQNDIYNIVNFPILMRYSFIIDTQIFKNIIELYKHDEYVIISHNNGILKIVDSLMFTETCITSITEYKNENITIKLGLLKDLNNQLQQINYKKIKIYIGAQIPFVISYDNVKLFFSQL